MQWQTRRQLMISCLLVLALLLAACGGSAAPAAPAESTDGTTGNEAAPPADPADTVAEPAEEEVVAIEASEDEETTLAGEIVISVQSNDTQTYQALADAYMELHPEVTVVVSRLQ